MTLVLEKCASCGKGLSLRKKERCAGSGCPKLFCSDCFARLGVMFTGLPGLRACSPECLSKAYRDGAQYYLEKLPEFLVLWKQSDDGEEEDFEEPEEGRYDGMYSSSPVADALSNGNVGNASSCRAMVPAQLTGLWDSLFSQVLSENKAKLAEYNGRKDAHEGKKRAARGATVAKLREAGFSDVSLGTRFKDGMRIPAAEAYLYTVELTTRSEGYYIEHGVQTKGAPIPLGPNVLMCPLPPNVTSGFGTGRVCHYQWAYVIDHQNKVLWVLMDSEFPQRAMQGALMAAHEKTSRTEIIDLPVAPTLVERAQKMIPGQSDFVEDSYSAASRLSKPYISGYTAQMVAAAAPTPQLMAALAPNPQWIPVKATVPVCPNCGTLVAVSTAAQKAFTDEITELLEGTEPAWKYLVEPYYCPSCKVHLYQKWPMIQGTIFFLCEKCLGMLPFGTDFSGGEMKKRCTSCGNAYPTEGGGESFMKYNKAMDAGEMGPLFICTACGQEVGRDSKGHECGGK